MLSQIFLSSSKYLEISQKVSKSLFFYFETEIHNKGEFLVFYPKSIFKNS